MTRSIIILCRLCEDVEVYGGNSSTQVFQILRCMKAGPAFKESQAEIFNRNIGADQAGFHVY